MNRRTLTIVSGILLLAAALYMIPIGNFQNNKPPQPANSAPHELHANSSNARLLDSEKNSRPAATNPSSGIPQDQVEAEIKRLLADDTVPLREAGEKLLAMAADPAIGKEMRTECLGHALNLVSDEEYEQMVLPYLRNNHFEDTAMQSVALHDAYNREDIAKLPAALAIFSHTTGEIHDEARDLMAFIMERELDNLGEDPTVWQQAITEHLQKRETEEE